MAVPRSSTPDVDRFLSYTDPTNANGCRLWNRGQRLGYGMFHFWDGDRRRSLSAHVWSYRHFVGAVPPGMVIRHTCDVQLCVEPSHLLVGTQADNIADKLSRNRQAKGESIAAAKLTDAQVRRIRQRYEAGNVSQRTLASEYGVAQSTIGMVTRGVRWAHVV